MAHVVVIGGGIGGLATAISVKAAGHNVTVLEQSDDVGGKVAQFTRDDFTFDTGPSLFTLPAVYRDIFANSGRPLDRVIDLEPVDPAFHYRFPDGTSLDVPNLNRGAIAASMNETFGQGTGEQWTKLLDRGSRIWDATRGPFLEEPWKGVRTMARLSLRAKDLYTVAPATSLRTLAKKYLTDPRLRMMADRYATYTGSDPRQAPAALLSIPYIEQAFGAWHVKGGIKQLAVACEQRCLKNGVTLRTGVRAAGLEVANDTVRAVVTDSGERLKADVVVSAIDVGQLLHQVVPGGRRGRIAKLVAPSYRRRAASLSGFVVMLALRGETPNASHHTVSFPADYDNEFDSIFGLGPHDGAPRPAPDPALYICNPQDTTMKPAGHEAWFVLVNAPRHSVDDRSWGVDWTKPDADGQTLGERYGKEIIDTLQRRGFDIKDRILWHEVRTPADIEADTGSLGGAIYGTSSNGARSAFIRPVNHTNIRGLFLTGGSAHPGGGLPLVGMGAISVAQQIGKA